MKNLENILKIEWNKKKFTKKWIKIKDKKKLQKSRISKFKFKKNLKLGIKMFKLKIKIEEIC